MGYGKFVDGVRGVCGFVGLEALERRAMLSVAVGAAETVVGGEGGEPDCGCGVKREEALLKAREAAEAIPTVAETKVSKLEKATAKSVSTMYKSLSKLPTAKATVERVVRADSMTPFKLSLSSIRSSLRKAPVEFSEEAGASGGLEFSLPNPDGRYSRFSVMESSVMEEGLEKKWSFVKTYVGQGIDDPTQVMRLTVSSKTFQATVLGGEKGDYYIDPLYFRSNAAFVAYYRADAYMNPDNVSLGEEETQLEEEQEGGGEVMGEEIEGVGSVMSLTSDDLPQAVSVGGSLRIYRIAIATTGEYTTWHGGTNAAAAAVVAAVARLNTVYERDLAVRLVLVANNNVLIFPTASTDPFTSSGDSTTTNSQLQSRLDSVIGNANYDTGHVFHRGSNNGEAGGIGTVGITGTKGKGYSSFSSPTGDPFVIDYVAHEVGHNFGGRHNFSSCRGSLGDSGSVAVEPGSGSTIMSYAGICNSSENLQANADAMFNSLNVTQITTYLNSRSTVGTWVATGNSLPVVSAGASYTIPARTPYTLTATATDADGDALTYSWEQRDGTTNNATSPANNPTGTSGPVIRPFLPTSSPSRTVPRLSNLLANTTVTGEVLSTVTRTMTMYVAVRDNRAGAGGFVDASMTLSIRNTGSAFAVTAPNTAVSWTTGSAQTVTWNVAGTTANNINTANVKITLSTDGGNTFPYVLAETTANDGSEVVTIPSLPASTTQARVKVEAVGNIYFDLSNVNFSITAVSPPTAPAAPGLVAGSDTGVSSSDRITRLNNSPGNTLSFVVSPTTAGETVRLFADGEQVGSAVAGGSATTVTTNGSTTLADGTVSFTATRSNANGTSAVSSATTVVIDTVGPASSFGVGSPLMVNGATSSVGLSFSEAVSGLPAGAFSLERDGEEVSTVGLSGTGGLADWSVGNLSEVSAVQGVYTLAFSGVGVTDIAGNAATGSSLVFTNNVILLGGEVESNTLRISVPEGSDSAVDLYLNHFTSTPSYAWTFAPGESLRVVGSGVGDTVVFTGSAGHNAEFDFRLGGGEDQVSVEGGTLVVGGNLGVSVGLSVGGGAQAVVSAANDIRWLSVLSGGLVTLGASLATAGLTLATDGQGKPTGDIDVGSHYLIVRGGSEATIRSYVGAWDAGGRFSGKGIRNNAAGGGGRDELATVGVRANGGLFSSRGTLPVGVDDIIVRYTYRGDSDFNGVLDTADLDALVTGLRSGLTGWAYGDSDYDGDVDANDLAILLTATRLQGAPFA